MAMMTEIAKIKMGERHRKDLGDINGLAESIREMGMLQPIGITEDKVLVFGERRLVACRDILGWEEIPARIVNVSSIVAGEYAENEVRKNFTPSERHAIGKALAEEIGNRLGRPTKEKSQKDSADFLKGTQTRDIVAQKSGLGSHDTYEKVGKVVSKGIPELVDAMDKKELSIGRAAEIAKLPPDEQREALQSPKPTPAKETKKQGDTEPQDSGLRMATQAMQLSEIAISQLTRIRLNDPRRIEALMRVRDYTIAQISGDTDVEKNNINTKLWIV